PRRGPSRSRGGGGSLVSCLTLHRLVGSTAQRPLEILRQPRRGDEPHDMIALAADLRLEARARARGLEGRAERGGPGLVEFRVAEAGGGRLPNARVARERHEQGLLALPQVAARALAGLLRVAEDAQQVVLHLEEDAERAPDRAEALLE